MNFWYVSQKFTKIQMYHIFYMKCTALLVFLCVFTVFSLQKYLLLVHFTCLYQNTHVTYILHEMHSFSSVFIVFSLCCHCRNMYFWYISHVYQNTYVTYILHEMHNFASVFMFFHCVFNAETCTFGTFHMFIPKNTWTMYSTWNTQFC
jgi:hypothetical protein